MNVDIRRNDVELLERLADAAVRSGHTQTAIQGYALALRLRAQMGDWPLGVMDAAKATEALDDSERLEEWLS